MVTAPRLKRGNRREIPIIQLLIMLNKMKKISFLLITFGVFTGSIFAQKVKVNAALFSLQEGKAVEAKQQIDEALQDPEAQAMAKSWMVKGDINKNIYETKVYFAQFPNCLFEARDAYMKAYEIEVNPKKKNDAAGPLEQVGTFFYNEGLTAFQSENWPEAYKQFVAYRDINQFMLDKGMTKKIDTASYFAAGISAYNAQMVAEAIPLLEKLVDMDYDNVAVYETLGSIYEEQDNEAKLTAFLQKALAKYPDDKNLQIIELNYNIKYNKVDESIKKLEQAVAKEPNNPSMLFNLAVMYDQVKKPVQALEYYNRVIKVKPDFADAYSNAGAVYFNQAVEINKIINYDDANRIDSFLVVLGKQELFTIPEVDAALKDKNYTNLLGSFSNVTDEVAFRDKVAKINDMIKYDLLQGARNVLYNKALPYLEKSFELDPENKGIRSALKEIYARMNMLDKAAKLNQQ